MKKLILLALLILALPAPAHAFWPFDDATAIKLTAPIAPAIPPTPEEEDRIWKAKQAQMEAMEQAFRKAHPEPAGPVQPPGPWCLIGHLHGHAGQTPLVCGYHTEAECVQHQRKGQACAK